LCLCLAFGADCPSSIPQSSDVCSLTGNAWMTCSYNRKECCPGTASARTIYGTTADCRNQTWTFQVAACSCASTVTASTCGTSAPASGSSCTGDVKCQYGKNMTCCDGSVQYSGTVAQCSGGKWLIGIQDGCLFGCPPKNSTCPSSASGFDSSACVGNAQCKYGKNTTCCNGDVQYVGSIVQCTGGQWVTASADGCLFGCQTQCPQSAPTNGAYCTFDTSITCKYGSGTAKCDKAKWVVNSGSFTSFCPATAPTNGQTCSPGSSSYIRCQYNSKTCSCGGGTIYQTDAWCRSNKLAWEVTPVSCPACLVQEN